MLAVVGCCWLVVSVVVASIRSSVVVVSVVVASIRSSVVVGVVVVAV